MRSYERRLRRLESMLLPAKEPKYCWVAFKAPGDKQAEAKAEEMRQAGFTVIEVRVMSSKEDIEKWRAYDDAIRS